MWCPRLFHWEQKQQMQIMAHNRKIIFKMTFRGCFKLTEWESWGRRCSGESHEDILQTPFCPVSAQSPCSHSQEICTLQTETFIRKQFFSHWNEQQLCVQTWLTCQRVVHVEAVTFDAFKRQASVYKNPARKQNNTKLIFNCKHCPVIICSSMNNSHKDCFHDSFK